LQVSFVNETYKRDDILQKRPIIFVELMSSDDAEHGDYP